MPERPLSSTFDPETSTLVVSGVIDELAAAEFTAAVAAALDGASAPVVVDLSDVDYFPSVAVSALIEAVRPHPDRYTLLARQGTIAQRVLHLCGLPHRTA